MDRDAKIKEVQKHYSDELKDFIEVNSLLNEDYFIKFKLRGLNEVVKAFEDVGEFFYGDDKFQYGSKAVNRNLFGYYILYIEFLNSRKIELETSVKASKIEERTIYLGESMNSPARELFEYLTSHYRSKEITNVKFINILHYLKNDTDKSLYIFKIKQREYQEIIKEKFKIDIKKFAKSEKYDEEEKHILMSIERDFTKQND